jgi:cellulose synthase operon protein C
MRLLVLLSMILWSSTGYAQGVDPTPKPADSTVEAPDPDDFGDEDEDDDEDEFEDESGESEEATTAPKNTPSDTKKDDTVTPADPPVTTGTPKAAPTTTEEKQNTPDGSSKKAEEKPKEDDPIGQCLRKGLEGTKKTDSKAKKVASPVDLELSRERRELEKAIRRYVATSKDFRTEARSLLVEAILKRKKLLNDRYGRVIDEAADRESKARNEAIARFEGFIKKYPRDPKKTPDAMYRLAELYFEKSEDDFQRADAKKERLDALYERGKLAEKPAEPDKNFKNSFRVWRTLLARFGKKHRFAAPVHYLIGYVMSEQGRTDEAIEIWTTLLNEYPKSEWTPEVILRVGELLFDNGEFDKAGEIYKKALSYKKSKHYGLSIYKLAWTYMQQDRYDPAIKTFIQLIEFYDVESKAKGAAQSATAVSVRNEAVEYLGRTLADNDWDGDGQVDAIRGFARAKSYLNKGKSYEVDIFEAYAKALYEEHERERYKQAIEVYSFLLDREMIAAKPAKPKYSMKALDFQLKMISCHDGIIGDIENQTAARRSLAENFGRSSAWYEANKENAKIIEEAEKQVDLNWQRYPELYHQHAQALGLQAKIQDEPDAKMQLEAKSKKFYGMAADGYAAYLKQYPGSKLVEKMRLRRADALYYSGQLLKAAQVYQVLATDPRTKKFRDAAALDAILTYEKIIDLEVAKGKLDARANPNAPYTEPEIPDSEKPKGTEKIVVQKDAMPALLESWMNAVDFFVDNDLKVKDEPLRHMEYALLAGRMHIRFKDLPGARTRFRKILACYPKSEFAADAATSIIDTYQRENDFPNVEKWANLIESRELGDPESLAKARKKIKLFKLGVRAQRAAMFFKEEKFLEAAKEFERLANETPDAPDADKFYFNAAKSYQKVKFYDSASNIFEKLVTDPRYKKSQFAEESLFSLADNYGKFFYYDKAIDAYMAHFNRYPESEDRALVLSRAAKAQLDNGELVEAAQTYELYADTFKGKDNAPSALFEAGLLYEKLKNVSEQTRIFETFIDRFSSKAGEDTRVLDANLRLAKIARARNRKKKTRKLLREVIGEFNKRAQQPASRSANIAAEAGFELLAPRFNRFTRQRLKGSAKKQQKIVLRKLKELQSLIGEYTALATTYKSNTWTICSILKQGKLWKDMNTTLSDAPEPQGLSDEMMGIYLDRMDAQLAKFENAAIRYYQKAVEKSREYKVNHPCARQALESINAYRPEQYPIFKEEKQKLEYEPIMSVDSSSLGVNP